MADLLTAVKSVRKSSKEPQSGSSSAVEISTSTPSSTATTNSTKPNDGENKTDKTKSQTSLLAIGNPDELLSFLRSEPDTDVLVEALKRFGSDDSFPGCGFCLAVPGATQAKIVNTLVDRIVPTYWWAIRDSSQREGLLSCLFNVAGFNAVIARLKTSAAADAGSNHALAPKISTIRDLLEISLLLFEGYHVAARIWRDLTRSVFDAGKRLMIWKEFVNLISSGRVIAAIVQGEDILKQAAFPTLATSWLSNGREYAQWLGLNISEMVFSADVQTESSAVLLSKALNLGYQVPLVSAIFSGCTQQKSKAASDLSALKSLVHALSLHARRLFLHCTLQWISTTTNQTGSVQRKSISEGDMNVLGISFLISAMNHEAAIQQQIIGLLGDPALSASLSIEARRGCVVALAQDSSDGLDSVLESLIRSFGDRLFINHAPIVQQEALAQTLLLLAGYLHRREPMAVLMTVRSSHHMQGVSNRLDSSNPRARWLGMVVGTALSSLIDKGDMKMKFGTKEMETEESNWYIGLVNLSDKLGTFQDFENFMKLQAQAPARNTESRTVADQVSAMETIQKVNGKPVFGPVRPPAQTEIIGERISEILDSSPQMNDDAGLKPYEKPDSDAEDSEEDATLVNRSKARAPVYIRDLMNMLRDDKDAERFQLGLKHAAGLVRRKSNFGAEVRDHAEELGRILCNLQDPFSTDDFEEQRLQGLIAVVLSDVSTMAPWLSRQTFTGEYSIAQRCAMLTALGLGGRELAGLKGEDELNPELEQTGFPTKRLPPRLDAVYRGGQDPATGRLEAATKSMEQQLIGPMAMEAAEKTTAHLNKLKVRNLSSRTAAERTKRKPAPNNLAKKFAANFFFPLANRYQLDIAAYGGNSDFARVPILLVTLLRTLSLLIHASGPSMPDISAVSVEMWDLLLSLQAKAVQDITVMQAVLFGLLTVLEINSDHRRVAQEHPKQLMQTQQWVDMVFERMGPGGLVSVSGDKDEVKVRTLAASVLLKTKEIIEAYQRELIGYDFG